MKDQTATPAKRKPYGSDLADARRSLLGRVDITRSRLSESGI